MNNREKTTTNMYDLNERKERQRLARIFAEQVLNSEERTIEERAAAEVVVENTASLTMEDVEWDDDKHLLGGATASGGGEVVMLSVSHNGNTITTNRGVWVRRLLTPNGKKYDLHELADGSLQAPEPSTKTMDQYSPEEQADMVGMWAKYDRCSGGVPDFVIIEGGVNQAGRVPCYNPEAPNPSAWAPDPWMLTPRFDLPRVWDKDGQPCEGISADAYPPKPNHPTTLSSVEDYENAPEGTVVDIAVNVFKRGPRGWLSTNNYSTYSPTQMSNFGKSNILRWGKTS